ncbi:MAG: YopX family protein [Streptococcus vestibularis]|uniref:YopX family protein n=1 Tax=Streptococcus vestibularis TaxID=1343 RepID=UPI0029009F63|nr:YopX family protein [Streptococcus vestibularis]MDU1715106.1 YopX family protein [Streptococcus vestibularis]
MIPKFRAWDKRSKEMWKVSTLHIEDEYVDLFKKNIYENPLNDPWAKFGDAILMQSTGLKDKNGVEIFEGGIGWDDHQEVHGQVIFENGAFKYEWENISEDLFEVTDDIEIVGNIYENSELLEGTE